jgi:hypothetical protein
MAAPTTGPSKPEHPGLHGHIDPLGASIIPKDWPAQAADQIVDTISTIRHKTTRPALVAARAVVYGLLLLVLGSILTVLAIVLVIRLSAVYAPWPLWATYVGLSFVFLAFGFVLLNKANKPASALEADAAA